MMSLGDGEPLPGQNVIEIVLPSYHMKPAEDDKFYPSQARKVAEHIIAEELTGKEYDEDDAREWSLIIAERVKAGVKGQNYMAMTSRRCNFVLLLVEAALRVPRYKIVVQVTIGQMRDQGVRVASRCLWDTSTDNYASVSFQNVMLTPELMGDGTLYQTRKKSSCDACWHKHSEGQYCHVFVRDDSLVAETSQASASQGRSIDSGFGTSVATETFETWLDDDDDIPGKERRGPSAIEATTEMVRSSIKTMVGGLQRLVKASPQSPTSLPPTIEEDLAEDAEEDVMNMTSGLMAVASLRQAPHKTSSMPYVMHEDDHSLGFGSGYRGEGRALVRLDSHYTAEPEMIWAVEQEQLMDKESVSGYSLEEQQVGDELDEPVWALQAGFRRCGCQQGVPNTDRSYTPVPETRYVGDIIIRTGDCKESSERAAPVITAEMWVYILSFLVARDTARCAAVSRTLLAATGQDRYYYDVSSMAIVSSFVAHDDFVEAMLARNGLLYTAGGKRCKLWDPSAASYLGVVFRDLTGILKLLLEEPRFLYSFMDNGQMRKWGLTFDPKKLDFQALAGEHSGCIKDCVISPPSDGHCVRHRLANHSCFLYTCCDDRTARVWDTSDQACLAVISPPARKSASLQSLALTDRHLLLGSSRGHIFVYTLEHSACEREDIHICKQPEVGPQPFCLQTTLYHGTSIVQCMAVIGPSYARTHIYSGSVDGTICVFKIPETGLDFDVLALWRAHAGPVNAFAYSWNHLYSGSTDATVKLWHLGSPGFVRALDCQGQTVKSLVVADSGTEDSRVYAGLASGVVVGWRIGLYG